MAEKNEQQQVVDQIPTTTVPEKINSAHRGVFSLLGKVHKAISTVLFAPARALSFTIRKPFEAVNLVATAPFKVIDWVHKKVGKVTGKIDERRMLKAQEERLKKLSKEYLAFKERTNSDPEYLPSYQEVDEAFSHGDTVVQWNDYIHDTEAPLFELFTLEYVDGMAKYLAERIEDEGKKKGFPVKILEIGAGNGRLTHLLQQRLNEQVPGKFEMTATDSKEWPYEIKTHYPVEVLDHKQAVEKHKPQIVLCSWMLPNIDLSAEIREAKSVDEYILIGDKKCCGNAEKTWGYQQTSPQFEKDGFTQQQLEELERYQIGRTDEYLDSLEEPEWFRISETSSFRRQANKAGSR